MSHKWKCGRKLPGRLAIVARESGWTINRIVANYSGKIRNCNLNIEPIIQGFEDNSLNNWGKLYFRNFREVLRGNRNTKRYIQILEECWKLPISEIRNLYQMDKLRPPDETTIREFVLYYHAIRTGKPLEEIKARAMGVWQ
jgi:hypothetical protein